MKRAFAASAMALVAGCTGHSAGAAPAQPTPHPRVSLRLAGESCLSAWNSSSNRAVRFATLPPVGPYPIAGDGPQITPQGNYEVFVSPIIFIGIGNLPPRCAVTFRFPHGYRDEPATVYYTERGTSGVFGDSEVSVGKNADERGRVFAQHPDGTLYPTPFRRG